MSGPYRASGFAGDPTPLVRDNTVASGTVFATTLPIDILEKKRNNLAIGNQQSVLHSHITYFLGHKCLPLLPDDTSALSIVNVHFVNLLFNFQKRRFSKTVLRGPIWVQTL